MSSEIRGDDFLTDIEVLAYSDLSRREVRSLIFHLLYAAEGHSYEDSLESIAENLTRGFAVEIPFDSEAFKTAQEIINHTDELDTAIKPFLQNWRFDRVGLCTKLILRYAMYEIEHSDVPLNIIINEAVELAKCFSEKDAYKFVNGILDEAAKERRPSISSE
jgi:N utilization substance protein B